MTEAEKVIEVQALIDDASVSATTIVVYLSIAAQKILERVYPFRDVTAIDSVGDPKYPMPSRYDHLQCELASRYIFRRGFEGQKTSSENGVNRGFGSVNDEDLLSEVIQIVGTVM